MKKITSLLMMFMLFVGMGWAAGEQVSLPQVSKDGVFHYYTIRCVKYTDKFVNLVADNAQMSQTTSKDLSSVFYFTEASLNQNETLTDVLKVNIHNMATDNTMSAWSQWNGNNTPWYVKVHQNGNKTGISIATSNQFQSGGAWNSWNDQSGQGKLVGNYFATDDGSLWILETVDFATVKTMMNAYADSKIQTVKAAYPKVLFGATDQAIATLSSSLNAAKETIGNPADHNALVTARQTFNAAVVSAENTIKASAGRTDLLPKLNAFYIIHNRLRGGDMSVSSDNKLVGTANETSNGIVSGVWFLEDAGNSHFYLKSEYLNKYVKSDFSFVDTKEAASVFKFDVKRNGAFGFASITTVDGGVVFHMNGGSRLMNYTNQGDAGSDWTFDEFKSEFPEFTTVDSEKKFYFIKHKRSGKFATYVGADNQISLSDNFTDKSFWYFIPSAENVANVAKGTIIYNGASELPVKDTKASENNDGNAPGTFGAEGKTWYIKNNPYKQHADGVIIASVENPDAGNLGNWDSQSGQGLNVSQWSYDSDNSTWYITSVEREYNQIAAKLDAYINNPALGGKEALIAARNLAHTTPAEYLTAFTEMKSALNAYEAAPFVFTDGTKIVLKNKLHHTYMLAGVDNLKMSVAADSYRNIWTLKTGKTGNAYYLYNEYTNMYVRSTTAVKNDTAIPLTSDVNQAGEFNIDGTLEGASFMVNFKAVDNTEAGVAYLHGSDRRRDNLGFIVVRWDATAAASQWELSSTIPTDEVLYDAIIGKVNPELYDYVDGFASNSDVPAALETMNTTRNLANYRALENAMIAGKISLGDAGYYQFVFRNDRVMGNWDAYMKADGKISEDAESRRVASADMTTAPIVPSLWSFVKAGTNGRKFKLTQANTSFGIGSVDKGHLVTTKDVNVYARTYTFTAPEGDGRYAMSDESVNGNNYINIFWNKGHNEENDGFGYYSGGKSDGGNVFRIKQIRSIPVVVKAAKWATLNLPMAVKVPAEVKAYYVTSIKGDAIYVSEITNVIPANTPVLLNAEANTYNFEITTEAGQAVSGNKLMGTTVKRIEVAEGQYYGLTMNEAQEVVFAPYVPTTATIPANKAMLAKENVPVASQQASALHFVFGEPTGVEAVDVENENSNVYYDLSGRRVLYPAKGIFVNGNGQKVIFK